MFITGPAVIREATGEEVSAEALGGPQAQMNNAGVAHFIAENDLDALRICKKLLSFLPSNNLEDPPGSEWTDSIVTDKALNTLVPIDQKKSYDVRGVIGRIVDAGDFLEVQPFFAPNIVVGFARILGRSIGIVANQPCVLAGALDIDASDKAARFVRFCNAFNLPLVTLVDVPGFLPGVQQEHSGIIRHGAKMLFAYSAATKEKTVHLTLTVDGKKYLLDVEVEEGEEVRLPGSFPEPTSTLQAHPAAPVAALLSPASPGEVQSGEKVCRSPIAGVVFKIVAQVGQQLEVDDLLVILEAMKMETNITAHVSGKVEKILVAVGEAVKPGQALAEFS